MSPRAWFQHKCELLHEQLKSVDDGTVATYIPELAKASRDSFAIAATSLAGDTVSVGDTKLKFTIQSISKLLVYAYALETHGREAVLARAGVEPTGNRFNSIEMSEVDKRAPNPMVNAGAIAMADMIEGKSKDERLETLLRIFERQLGRKPEIDDAVWASERETGHRNRAIGYLLLSRGTISDRVEETLDLYFAQCSVLFTVEDLAVMGATLANRGVHPVTGQTIILPKYVPDVLTVALTCGMYDYAGEWAYAVGIPAKSGISGGIVGAASGRGGIAVYSPPLDRYGNSVRGTRAFEALSREYGLHLFAPDDPWPD